MKFKPPKLFIHGEIGTETYSQFSQELSDIEEDAPKDYKGYIDVELTSEGGSAYDALGFYDRIRNSRLNIRITGTGLIASAAVLVLAAGDLRRMTSNAWVMVHEDTPPKEYKQVHKHEKDIKHYRRLEDQWCELLEKTTGTDRKEWSKLHKEESYLTAVECRYLGLIEEII